MERSHLHSLPARPRTSIFARVLGWVVLALFLAAVGAALLAGLTAFLIFLVLLIPVLLLLVAVALTGRGSVRIRVHSAARKPEPKPEGRVAHIEHDR